MSNATRRLILADVKMHAVTAAAQAKVLKETVERLGQKIVTLNRNLPVSYQSEYSPVCIVDIDLAFADLSNYVDDLLKKSMPALSSAIDDVEGAMEEVSLL